jgi:hypothetical protein
MRGQEAGTHGSGCGGADRSVGHRLGVLALLDRHQPSGAGAFVRVVSLRVSNSSGVVDSGLRGEPPRSAN